MRYVSDHEGVQQTIRDGRAVELIVQTMRACASPLGYDLAPAYHLGLPEQCSRNIQSRPTQAAPPASHKPRDRPAQLATSIVVKRSVIGVARVVADCERGPRELCEDEVVLRSIHGLYRVRTRQGLLHRRYSWHRAKTSRGGGANCRSSTRVPRTHCSCGRLTLRGSCSSGRPVIPVCDCHRLLECPHRTASLTPAL